MKTIQLPKWVKMSVLSGAAVAGLLIAAQSSFASDRDHSSSLLGLDLGLDAGISLQSDSASHGNGNDDRYGLLQDGSLDLNLNADATADSQLSSVSNDSKIDADAGLAIDASNKSESTSKAWTKKDCKGSKIAKESTGQSVTNLGAAAKASQKSTSTSKPTSKSWTKKHHTGKAVTTERAPKSDTNLGLGIALDATNQNELMSNTWSSDGCNDLGYASDGNYASDTNLGLDLGFGLGLALDSANADQLLSTDECNC